MIQMCMRKDHRILLSFSFLLLFPKTFFEKTIMVVLASVLPSFSNCLSLHFDMHSYPTYTESNDYGLLGTSVGPELEGATMWSQQDRRR